jgi:polyisoprenoid-binding protein YceI
MRGAGITLRSPFSVGRLNPFHRLYIYLDIKLDFDTVQLKKGDPLKTTYKIDPAHSTAHFVVRHMMITNVRGGFSGVQGTVEYDPDNPNESRIDVVIDAGQINTLDEQRDTHLKSPDFLHVEQHPTITFKSKKIERAGDGEWKVTGDLTIHGVTKEVVLDAEGPTPEGKDPFGNTRIGASASTKIKRSDFGLTWNAALETGGILVGDDLKIELEVSAIRSESAVAV